MYAPYIALPNHPPTQGLVDIAGEVGLGVVEVDLHGGCVDVRGVQDDRES